MTPARVDYMTVKIESRCSRDDSLVDKELQDVDLIIEIYGDLGGSRTRVAPKSGMPCVFPQNVIYRPTQTSLDIHLQ